MMSDITVHREYVEQSNYLLYYTSVVSGIIKNGLNPKAVKSCDDDDFVDEDSYFVWCVDVQRLDEAVDLVMTVGLVAELQNGEFTSSCWQLFGIWYFMSRSWITHERRIINCVVLCCNEHSISLQTNIYVSEKFHSFWKDWWLWDSLRTRMLNLTSTMNVVSFQKSTEGISMRIIHYKAV